MTAMWHDVFVCGERSAVQPVHAVTLQLLAVSRWIAPCPSPTYTVCWPSRLGALFLSHSCALWTRNRCVRSNQGQALFSVRSPLGLTSCSVWSSSLGNEIGYAGQELRKQSLYMQLVVWLQSENLHGLFFSFHRHYCVKKYCVLLYAFKDEKRLQCWLSKVFYVKCTHYD